MDKTLLLVVIFLGAFSLFKAVILIMAMLVIMWMTKERRK